MSSWVLLAIIAQLFLAVVTFVDRYVLTHGRGIGKPIAYTFYVSLLSGFVIVLVPFGVISMPNLLVLEFSLLATATFILSLYFLYTALKEGHASDVMPVVAAVSAITSFVLASQWLSEHLPPYFLAAAILFVIGTFLISRLRLTRRQIVLVIGAGFFFGCSAFLTKIIFEHTSFIDGFFWSRMANVVGAAALFAVPAVRSQIMHGTRQSSHGTKWLVIGNKTLAGIASVLTLFAISSGSVSVVNAMSGLQFAFLLMLAFLFASRFPLLRGEIGHEGMTHKLWGIGIIVLGMALLYIA
ncbi:hypothetical protein A2765_00950 [Candidatus Kaiserbacteria bacterium RIFCSPHIGHO2_01_FULL_56_24]|uniref:EamA domain-containing protein n=1 Tax=Candidatus Kaiserbacteria bacterium RIFCSPHIGHO2_01_FULL_56_24 TaxID=1798487 RepID=A0A1F6DFB2_9BACT|nr:MAG: hypothetical protein A2765_00950 [Candidatus Kaiserbacteria bacterium RIFCSPHIGHO2_01_FULL_56_24]